MNQKFFQQAELAFAAYAKDLIVSDTDIEIKIKLIAAGFSDIQSDNFNLTA